MDLHSSLQETKMIAIIRGSKPEDVHSIAEALWEGGITVLEITLNSPGALEVIKQVSREMDGRSIVGAGTVLDPESARAALLAGAKFILSPTVDEGTIRMTKRYGAVSIPGAFTPTEILKAYEYGGDIVKVFPATTLGPSYVKDIHGPLPQIPLLPTGGIGLENVADFIKAGAVGVGLGSSLVNTKEAVTNEYLKNLTGKARSFVNKVKEADRGE
ncbi:2-dehydro-3-deoxyphosphogluconate aldolase [Bacillus sp. FJAT-18017]|uniref:bifunctional 4-hydroxy-2-oxoglutarate aldolase/2-dehydro-3-deoxy-phosphogluconate aldolase n=1 Tax=Bacillus sp. FJAT-18017 TaxID=1705566 RepID=UPI0006B00E82|nr:bifunctional 4-hydroxy-2-oxoglutarate aldolase/2-dehydro-3-deoxy-phosphogluconate aldolase [Bacillus sp. FJAT-18017]ALC89429.1 2-dehydro-3-deoxyphosphogluconate aldolase [Bacillus sp. FJAT-18017]